MRIEQIIDGNEIEAGAEFFPEEPFRHRGQQQHERQRDQQRHAGCAHHMPAREAVRHQRQQQD